MKKHILLLASIMLLTVPSSWAAFHFSQVAPSGQTLYFNITDSVALTVEVTCPGESYNNAYSGYIMPTGDLVIPATVSHNDTTYTVTAIGAYAFFACDSIMSLELPSTVTTIAIGAFSNCVGISGLVVPSTVTAIEDRGLNYVRNVTYHGNATGSPWGALGVNAYYKQPFTYADSTKTRLLGFDAYASSADIPATVTYIGDYAFCGCKVLDSIVIPGTVTEFGSMVFFSSEVKKVILSEGLTAVPAAMFTSCRELVEVSLPSTITRIEEGAFMDCETVPSIVVPNAVTYVGEYAFALCYGLQSLTLGRAVDTLASNAFSMCMSLNEINALNPVAPALGNEVFLMVPPTAVINIPCGSTDSYDSIWGAFFTDFVEVSPVVTVRSDNDSLGYAEVIVEPSCANPLATIQATAGEGYVFSHWSNGSTDNPYSFNVTNDTTLTAYFATLERISDIDNAQWNATVSGGTIILNGIGNRHVRIFDTLGRILYSETPNAETITIQTPNAGVYMVQVGNSSARRLVTIN